ncbi:MAG: hypothetical protein AB7E32_02990 [Desulfovibrio sp.]
MASWQEEYKLIVVKLVAAVVVAVVLAWVFLLPVFERSASLHAEMDQLQTKLRQQTFFLPEEMRLRAILDRDTAEGFELPRADPVKISEIDVLPPRFVRVAMDAGMEVLDVVVSPSSLRTGSGRIQMQCVVFGDMPRFQGFYHALCALPYVQQVDRLEMRAVPGGIEFLVEYWVLLDETKG